ncbi:deoxyribose-phosphate aldolase [Actinomyces sp. zg-332]|uniref:deoxyribose-phosphate aldolase n=1 Tax=Actinomyces sp. zg-332 TaxID=2708340 RepID=UPI001E350A20|nr:deoxyribose-phosphate aldolase [Actinomyces sp. zg-332]
MELNSYIDHTLLKADATASDIEELVQEAVDYNFAAVCVQGCWVSYAKDRLSNSDVKVATVVGFPLGGSSTESKGNEASNAVINGADEIDMVINVGWALSGMWDSVQADIENVVVSSRIAELLLSDNAVDFENDLDSLYECSTNEELQRALNELKIDKNSFNTKVKVILETSLLDNEQIKNACECARVAGADFVKTSTGFSSSGAKLEHVQLMCETVGNTMEIKASGGIRSYEEAIEFINAGASRLGTSASVKIVTEQL